MDSAEAAFAVNDPAEAAALGFSIAEFGSTEFSLNGPGSAENQEHVYSMVSTGSILSPTQYPLFDSERAVSLTGPPAFEPATATYAVAESDDEGWQRLRKTIDLTGATDAQPGFTVSITSRSCSTPGRRSAPGRQCQWTTLPDVNGHTTTYPGESCLIDWRSLSPLPRPLPDRGHARGGVLGHRHHRRVERRDR